MSSAIANLSSLSHRLHEKRARYVDVAVNAPSQLILDNCYERYGLSELFIHVNTRIALFVIKRFIEKELSHELSPPSLLSSMTSLLLLLR